MGTLLAVAAGGALGAVARWGVASWFVRVARSPLPWGTLAINVTGSLALGFLVVWLQTTEASAEVRGFLTVGVLGGFTTFSTFSYETIALVQAGQAERAVLYALGSVALGAAAAFAGMALARELL